MVIDGVHVGTMVEQGMHYSQPARWQPAHKPVPSCGHEGRRPEVCAPFIRIRTSGEELENAKGVSSAGRGVQGGHHPERVVRPRVPRHGLDAGHVGGARLAHGDARGLVPSARRQFAPLHSGVGVGQNGREGLQPADEHSPQVVVNVQGQDELSERAIRASRRLEEGDGRGRDDVGFDGGLSRGRWQLISGVHAQRLAYPFQAPGLRVDDKGVGRVIVAAVVAISHERVAQADEAPAPFAHGLQLGATPERKAARADAAIRERGRGQRVVAAAVTVDYVAVHRSEVPASQHRQRVDGGDEVEHAADDHR